MSTRRLKKKLFMPNKCNLPPAVVLGMSATGLSVARSLGRKGIEVHGLDSSKQVGMYSRYVKPIISPNVIEKEREFIDRLIDLGKSLPKPVILLCAHDEYIGAVSRNREELKAYFRFNIPAGEIVENFLDKRKSYTIAKDCGIECPATYVAENIEDVKIIANKVRFPCALKPAISHTWRVKFCGKKLISVNSPEELLNHFSEVKNTYPQIMIQELIPGKDDQIYLFYAYFNSKSEPLAFFIPRKLRQYPIHFGVGCYNISEMNEDVKNIGFKLLTKIKYTGMGAVELKRDSKEGKFKFMELNMRFIMIGELAIASGVDFPYIMYRDLIGEKVEKTSTFKDGVRLLNLELDLGAFWNYRKQKEITLTEYINSFKGIKKLAYTYFAVDDLRPFMHVHFNFIKAIFKKAKKDAAQHIKDICHRLLPPVKEGAKWGYSFVPVHIRNGTKFFDELKFLQKSQWWSKGELENYQNEKLQGLIRHSYENVPYYRSLFNEKKLCPNDIRSMNDLFKIPILTKDDIRKNFNSLIAQNIKRKDMVLLSTSGTTGVPLHFYVDRKNEYLTGAPVQWRFYNWGGRKFGDTMAALDIWLLKPHINGQRRLFQYNPVQRCLFLSMHDLKKENIKKYANAIRRCHPRFLKIYPSALEQLIKLLRSESVELDLDIKTIFTNAEILYPWQRKLFQDYFKCNILEWYALQERTIVAAQCEKQDAYHISSEYGIFEFLRTNNILDSDDQLSEIISTGLTNFVMPLIRYKTNDLGYPVEKKCECGRGLPLMKLVGGRERNFYLNRYDAIVPFTNINVSRGTRHLKKYQFVQEEKGKFLLKIVKDELFSHKDEQDLKALLNNILGDTMSTEMVFVDDIQRNVGGKLPLFIQRIPLNTAQS